MFCVVDSPRSWLWRCYHAMCWLLSAVGVVCILIAHEHYSIDVVVAYFITSRLFYWYHTMANNQVKAYKTALFNFQSIFLHGNSFGTCKLAEMQLHDETINNKYSPGMLKIWEQSLWLWSNRAYTKKKILIEFTKFFLQSIYFSYI